MTNPERYPLSTRIIDVTGGCGSVLHGRKSGKRLVYECGRYVNSGVAECHHNTVDVDAMLKRVLDSLLQCVTKAGGREAIRERLLAKARAEAAGEAPNEEHAAILYLRRRVAELGMISPRRGSGWRGRRILRWGVIAFGQENLPVRVHGARHIAVEETVPAAPSPLRRLVTQSVRRL